MNEEINKEELNINNPDEFNGSSLAKEFVETAKEIRGGIFGISKRKVSEIISDIPYDVLAESIYLFEKELDMEVKNISIMPPIGGMPLMGNAIKINNIQIFIETIKEKLKIN